MKETRWPDPTTGNPSSTLKDTRTVNGLGQTRTATDRNGSVHTLSYDVLGRLTTDAVTTLGTNVDGAVRRLEIAYDTQGNPYLFTSYNASSGGTIVNQVQREFNGLAQLKKDYQSHSGAHLPEPGRWSWQPPHKSTEARGNVWVYCGQCRDGRLDSIRRWKVAGKRPISEGSDDRIVLEWFSVSKPGVLDAAVRSTSSRRRFLLINHICWFAPGANVCERHG